MTDPMAALARAEEIAETVFFPAALDVDRSDTIPKSHLDRLAEEGFYGLAGPPEYGGLTASQLAPFSRIVETLASGCLATTFVWLQHHGAVRATAASDRPGIREQWTPALCRGDRRAGVVQAALRPGPSSLRAHARHDGWVFEGDALWVSGWGMVDTFFTAARAADDGVVWALLDADGSLTATPQELIAANASRTVAVHFDDVFVPAERVVGTAPLQPTSPDALRVNGALALAVARRCIALLENPAGAGIPGGVASQAFDGHGGAGGPGGGGPGGGGPGGGGPGGGGPGGGGPGGGGPGGGGPGGGGPGGGGPGGGGPGGGGPGGGGPGGGGPGGGGPGGRDGAGSRAVDARGGASSGAPDDRGGTSAPHVGGQGGAGGLGPSAPSGPGPGGPGGPSDPNGPNGRSGAGDFAASLNAFRDELDACRDAMDTAEDVPGARARAADLALRLAATLVVKQGARAILRDQHAQRLMREATFLLVFGTRAPIQQTLLELVSRA